MIGRVGLLGIGCALTIAASSAVFGQDEGEAQSTDSAATITVPAVQRDSLVPFTAQIKVDTPAPVDYGDDIVFSVWITPSTGLEMNQVRIHPKGALATIYKHSEIVNTNPVANEKPVLATVNGVPCRLDVLNRPANIPFVATCRLTSMAQGWHRWFDANTLIVPGEGEVEAEIVLQVGTETATYYERKTLPFTSPNSAVITGGFCGALLWALFLALSRPMGRRRELSLASWREVWNAFNSGLPHHLINLILATWDVLRASLLGSFVAMVLIIAAQSTEGFEPPISVHIQDFWGGLMIGILSVPLAKWIREKFGAPVVKTSDEAPAA